MPKMMLVPALAAMAVVGAPAAASQSNSPATAAQPAAPAAKEKKVCRSEADIGTIMRKRTCRTLSEWAAIDQANTDNAARALDNRRNGSVNPNE